MKFDLLFKFSLTRSIEEKFLKMEILHILSDDEEIEFGYTHVRDKVWFTNKRIVTLDVQGLSGNKKEFRSFSYNKITSFSIETAGNFDGDSDFKIWLSGVGVFQIKFDKNIDIKSIGKFMSNKTLN